MIISPHVALTVTLRVTTAHHTQPVPLFADSSTTIAVAAAIMFALGLALTLIVASRFRRGSRELADANRMAWAMLRPFQGRLQATENASLELAEQIKALAESQAKIVTGLQKQRDKTESLGTYIEEALHNDAKFASHLIEINAALMAAGKSPTPRPVATNPATTALPIPLVTTGAIARLTGTELQVLELLQEKGSLPAPEIGRHINKTREHTARLMKALFEQGYVERETARIPFRYRLSEKIREAMKSSRRTLAKVTESDASGAQTGS